MMLAALLFVVGNVERPRCSLMRPVASDAASARRIADAVISNVPASARARAAKEAGEPYELTVEADPNDPEQWVAFESPADKRGAAGEIIAAVAAHGLGFRINRCTGAISNLHYQR